MCRTFAHSQTRARKKRRNTLAIANFWSNCHHPFSIRNSSYCLTSKSISLTQRHIGLRTRKPEIALCSSQPTDHDGIDNFLKKWILKSGFFDFPRFRVRPTLHFTGIWALYGSPLPKNFLVFYTLGLGPDFKQKNVFN